MDQTAGRSPRTFTGDQRIIQIGPKFSTASEYIQGRIRPMVNQTIQQALSQRLPYTNTVGSTKTYGRADLRYDQRRGFLKLADRA